MKIVTQRQCKSDVISVLRIAIKRRSFRTLNASDGKLGLFMSRDYFCYVRDKDVVRSPDVPMSRRPCFCPKCPFISLPKNETETNVCIFALEQHSFLSIVKDFSKVKSSKTREVFLAKGQPVIKRHARGETRKMQTFFALF